MNVMIATPTLIPEYDQAAAIRLFHRITQTLLLDPEAGFVGQEGASSPEVMERRAEFLGTICELLTALIRQNSKDTGQKVARGDVDSDILWSASALAGLVGYYLATGHDHLCINCLQTRAQVLLDSMTEGFREGLETIIGSGGRTADGSVHAGH